MADDASLVSEARRRLEGMSTAERRELLLDFKRRCESDERAAHEMLAADALLGMTLLLAQLEMGSVDEEALHAAARDAKAASAAARPDGDGARASAGQVDAKPTQPQHVELIKQVMALTPEMMQGLSPYQQQQLLTLQHLTRERGAAATRAPPAR